MLEDIKFQWRLRQLQKKKSSIESDTHVRVKEAEKAKNRDLKSELISEFFFETDYVNNEIHDLQHRYICDKAEKYFLPLPPFVENSPEWEKSDVDDQVRLSQASICRLRSDIRKETKERHEQLFRWLAAIIGVIGALTGLAAVLI